LKLQVKYISGACTWQIWTVDYIERTFNISEIGEARAVVEQSGFAANSRRHGAAAVAAYDLGRGT
jgi:hypothetical protein